MYYSSAVLEADTAFRTNIDGANKCHSILNSIRGLNNGLSDEFKAKYRKNVIDALIKFSYKPHHNYPQRVDPLTVAITCEYQFNITKEEFSQ